MTEARNGLSQASTEEHRMSDRNNSIPKQAELPIKLDEYALEIAYEVLAECEINDCNQAHCCG